MMMLLLLLLLVEVASSCVETVLVLDFSVLGASSTLETELAESWAIVFRKWDCRIQATLDDERRCRNRALRSECHYCLEAGVYGLTLYDLWGDGWRGGSYALTVDAAPPILGTLEAGPCGARWDDAEDAVCAYNETVFFLAEIAATSPAPSGSPIPSVGLVVVELDWRHRKFTHSDRHAAGVALKRNDETTLLRPLRVYDVATEDSYSIRPQDPWVRFNANHSSLFIAAEYKVPPGDYALLLREDEADAFGWLGGIARVRDRDTLVVDNVTLESSDNKFKQVDFTVDRSSQQTIPLILSLNWTRSDDADPGAQVRVFRVKKEEPQNVTTLSSPLLEAGELAWPLEIDGETEFAAPANSGVAEYVLNVRPEDDLLLRLFCYLAGDADDPWRGGLLRVIRAVDDALILESTARGCNASSDNVLDIRLDGDLLLAQLPTSAPSVAPPRPTVAPEPLVVEGNKRRNRSDDDTSETGIIVAIAIVALIASAALYLAVLARFATPKGVSSNRGDDQDTMPLNPLYPTANEEEGAHSEAVADGHQVELVPPLASKEPVVLRGRQNAVVANSKSSDSLGSGQRADINTTAPIADDVHF